MCASAADGNQGCHLFCCCPNSTGLTFPVGELRIDRIPPETGHNFWCNRLVHVTFNAFQADDQSDNWSYPTVVIWIFRNTIRRLALPTVTITFQPDENCFFPPEKVLSGKACRSLKCSKGKNSMPNGWPRKIIIYNFFNSDSVKFKYLFSPMHLAKNSLLKAKYSTKCES